jgi:hypothetical protein
MSTKGTDPPEFQPILSSLQSELLDAALKIYAAENIVDRALEDLVAAPDRYVCGARSWWIMCEEHLDEMKEKRKAVEARIARADCEARGARWLRLVRDAA